MKRLLLYCSLFWAAHHDSSEYNVSIKGVKVQTELLPGASILAIHTPTGSRYSALSNGR
jgi:hypothetical protein